ncbi:MAG: ThiF family adenylyltransferase [Nannocystaceae bacterium]|nr:ThiF family adenylyltransferase [Nannocystaceae bacterium]
MRDVSHRGEADTHFWVVGAGGLGCPALLGLLGAGARRITVIDHDRVETHNLQRQVLYSVADVGARKAEAAAFALRLRAPNIEVDARVEKLDTDSLAQLIADAGSHAVVLECTDSPDLKFAANDAGLRYDTPVVIAAALGWAGQAIAVHRAHACYRCIYEAPPAATAVPSCEEAGVLGAGVGLLGFIAAHLAVTLANDPTQHAPCGSLHRIDLLSGTARRFQPAPRPSCPGPHTVVPRASAASS